MSHGDERTDADRELTRLRARVAELEAKLTPRDETRGAEGYAPALERAQEELRRLRKAVDRSGEVIFLTDREGVITYVNPEFTSAYGYEADAVVGKVTPRILKSGLARPSDYRAFWSRILSGQVVQGEVVNRTRDGQLRVFYSSANAIEDDAGRIRGFLCIQRDITEQKRAEEQLRLASFSIEHARDAVYWIGSDGRFVFVNQEACRSLGRTREELLSLHVWDLDPDMAADTWRKRWQHLRERGSSSVESAHRSADGTLIPVQVAATHVSFGGREYAFALARDLTELRSLWEQLHQAQKMEAVGRLAGGVAHDFNNLLSVIISFTDLVLEDMPEGDPARADLLEVREAGRRAAELSRQLLIFSRREMARPEVLDLNACVTSLDKLLRRIIGEDIELQTVTGPQLWNVRLNAGHVDQVLANLAVNSRDAMAGGGRLTIETANVELWDTASGPWVGIVPGRYVCLTVVDTGCGMSTEVAARAMEPFFTTKPAGKGTGLGLSIVYGIVSGAGGHVRIHSVPGEGTTFYILLPAVTEDETGVASDTPGLRQADARGETVLVVEDEDIVRSLVTRILRRGGYRVVEASNAGEALLIFEREQSGIDLLVSDVVMPHVSGKELSDRLRRVRPDLKVLFMSGYSDETLSMDDFEARGAMLLPKPFAREELLNAVRSVLDGI